MDVNKNEDDDELEVENNDQSDEYSEEINFVTRNSHIENVQDNEESLRRTPSSLNNYSILPPIKSSSASSKDSKRTNVQKQDVLKHLQEKYQHAVDKNVGNDPKLDDAYLKMKRLDKALEEAFEKEKLVKIETMSLMKKLRNEMQSMTVAFNTESNDLSHTQSNLKRFLALDDEILKLDGYVLDDSPSNRNESIFKTQFIDPLADSASSTKTDKTSSTSNAKGHASNNKKKMSISSNSSMSRKDKQKSSKIPEKDFIQRNIELAKELGGTWALTDDEKQRLNEILNEDDQERALVPLDQQNNAYIPSKNDTERLKEIDDILEKEYYNPFLNHQLKRHTNNDIDSVNIQQITNEENDQLDDHFGEPVLKETRLQREHMKRLKSIDEQLDYLQKKNPDDKIEAILSDEQLNELLGQCAVDEMKQRFSYLNYDKQNSSNIDFNDLSHYTLTHYVENKQGPMITDEIIQLLINEAQQEGIVMRQIEDENEEDTDFIQQQQQQNANLLSLAPAIDRPLSSTSTASSFDPYIHN